MLLKLLKHRKTGEVSIGVLHKEQWVPIRPLLEHCKNEVNKTFGNIASITDIVLLLGDWKKAVEEIQDLLAYAENVHIQYEEYQGGGIMPFQPKSYRDFMLYEQHVLDSGRGFIREFMPGMAGMVKFVEKVTGKPFSKIKPNKLWYQKPIYYMGNHMTFQPDGSVIEWPSYSKCIDYELELGVLVTKHIYNAAPEEAKDAIGGFLIFNDCSARDVQLAEMQSGFGPSKAKHFANVISDVVATPDEVFPYWKELKTRVYINGKPVCNGKIDAMYHSIENAVAYASAGEHIYPGEFMGSGTVAGCSGIETNNLLKYGDTVRFEIDRLGSMSTIISEKPRNVR